MKLSMVVALGSLCILVIPLVCADIPLIGKASDVQYSETTTASGEITAFSKVLSYQSGIRRV